MPRCLVFGDSNSYGWPPEWRRGETVVWPGNTAWPKVMAAELGPDWDVVTDALPGRLTVHDDSVEGGMRNGLTVLQSALYAHGPVDLFIVMLGTNDLKNQFSVTGLEISRSVGRLIEFAKTSGMTNHILAIAPVPVSEVAYAAGDFRGAEAKQLELPQALAEECAFHRCEFFNAGDVAAVSPCDGVHLDESAHAAIGNAIARKVREMGISQ